MKRRFSREEIIQGLEWLRVFVESDEEMYGHSKNVGTFSELLNGAVDLLKKDDGDAEPAQAMEQKKAVLERIKSEIKGAAGNGQYDRYWLGWEDAMREIEGMLRGTRNCSGQIGAGKETDMDDE